MKLREVASAQYTYCKLFDFCRDNGNRKAKCVGIEPDMIGSFFCVRKRRYCCALCLELDRGCSCVCPRIKERTETHKKENEKILE